MTAAWAFAFALLLLSISFLAGELYGRRAERRFRRERIGRLNSEQAHEAVSRIGLPDELADNDRWSRKVTHLEVVQ